MNKSHFSTTTDIVPVRLSYVAALRGLAPKGKDIPFAYAQMGLNDTEAFVCLAASNPEGLFYAVVQREADATAGQNLAATRKVENAFFVTDIKALPKLDFLVCDTINNQSQQYSRAELAGFASALIQPNGLMVYRYKAHENMDEVLRFLVNECAPELNEETSREFLHEIKALGTKYFAEHSIARASLDGAIEANNPKLFFDTCKAGNKHRSGTFDVMADFFPRGFIYVGDANISSNYLEVSVPAEAQELLLQCQDNLLYETIKDFVMQRSTRCDIWCRTPIKQTENIVALYSNFTFGITMPRDKVPNEVAVNGKIINLRFAPFPGLIDLISLMPVSIGDFMQSDAGKMVSPVDAVGAVQVLVASGIATPMRSYYQGQDQADLSHPKWATGFNSYMNETPVTKSTVLLASPVVGGAVSVSARDALVIQALNRVGMVDSIAALLPELMRISADPALASQISDVAEPTVESAHNMINEVVTRSMIKWYAYGLLAA